MIEILSLLENLQGDIKKCTACSMHKFCKQPVAFAGNLASQIVVIGRDPGATEDETGCPFVGTCGKLLQDACTEAGFDIWTECFITNTNKCRPTNNIAPPLSQYKFCYDLWLKRELDIIQPKVIIILGKEALYTVLPGFKMNHGEKFVNSSGVKYYHLFHPRFWVENGKMEYARRNVIPNLKTWFLEWENDGFIVRKNLKNIKKP